VAAAVEGRVTSRRGLAIGVGSAAVLLAALDAYVVVTVLIAILTDLGISNDQLQKATPIVTGYLLGYVAGMPLLGSLSDRFGRRLVVQACLAAFAIGSAITASAHGLPVMTAGRALQGLAGGALLPVTMALASDLWDEHRRPVVLGAVGAAQELGSVLGPLYGAGLALLFHTWRGIFWVNIPLAVAAMVAVQVAVPGRHSTSTPSARPRVDVGGGLLLALSLALLVIGFYNPTPETSILPPWGPATAVAGGACFVGFLLWERFARTRLIDPAGVDLRGFLTSLGASFLAGAALMVTLIDVQLVAQTLLDKDSTGGALILTRFLLALPIGALLGGVLVPRLGERTVAIAALLLAAGAYWLISGWPLQILAARHVLGPVSLPRLDTDLALAGLGLGLVISPLAAAVLRAVPANRHGVASAGVVVARTMGMLLGVAGLTAWGLNHFHQLTATLNIPPLGADMEENRRRIEAYRASLNAALQLEYHEIFRATAMICLLGAALCLLLRGKARTAA
jgi:MFS family permease